MDVKMIVYSPPQTDFPHLAVIFRDDGKLVSVEAVGSADEGAKFLKNAKDTWSVLQPADA
jgi:hypothetical protein